MPGADKPRAEKPKVVVVGAGAMGSLFGGLLAEGGLPVTLLARRPTHVEAIKAAGGLRIVGHGGERLVPIAATTEPASITQADLVLFQCKAGANEQAATDVRHLFGTRGAVAISFQNGLGNEEAIGAVLGEAHILAGLTAQGARLEEPGTVRNFTELTSFIGELLGGTSERVERLAAILTAHGLPTQGRPDIMREKWKKLFANIAFSATSGATGLPLGDIADLPPLRETALRAIDEAAAVASACGIPFGPEERRETFAQIVAPGGAGANTASMYRDLRDGRTSEVEPIYGSVISRAKQHGVPIPTIQTLHAIIKGIERRIAG